MVMPIDESLRKETYERKTEEDSWQLVSRSFNKEIETKLF